MSQLPSRRRIWAIAYGLTIVATLPLVMIQQGWSSPVTGKREGVVHLKRGLDTVDVDSLLDVNQPDFFLRIEMDKPSPATSPEPEATPAAAIQAIEQLQPTPTPEPVATPVPRTASYESQMLAEEDLKRELEAPPVAKPAAAPAPRETVAPLEPESRALAAERTQIVADALYHAPRLAQQGRYQRALEVVDAALGVDERVAPLHALRGSICYKLGRERQAEEGWARALELDPRLTDAQQALDWIRNRRR